jgi:trimeric autotransporter adhesin
MKHSWDFRRFGVALGLIWSMVGPMDLWAQGLPQGEVLIHGQAGFERDGTTLTIRQESDTAIINYDSFSIGRDHTVQFIQPDVSASALNRVTGSGRSEIAGALLANGQVYLINPNGILFTESARVDVGGLVASSMQISDQDFLSGRMYFDGIGADVINEGVIEAVFAYLVGRNVANRGSINAAQVAIAAGESSVLIDKAAGGRIEIVIDQPGASADAAIQAPSEDGEAENVATLPSAVVNADLASTVMNEGIIDATGHRGGEVTIGGSRIGQMGEISANGLLSDGGVIELRASGMVVLGNDSITTANADTDGHGGEILIIGEDTAVIGTGARIEARGGSESGDGGFVETSGYESFHIGAAPDVSAPAGNSGTWLIDPYDIEIVDNGGFDGADIVEVVAGEEFEGRGVESQIDSGRLAAALNSANVTIRTWADAPDLEDGDITVSAAVNWNSAFYLQLESHNDIIIGAQVSNAGIGDLTLIADSDVDGSGNITINDTISLAGGVFTASGIDFDIAAPGSITTDGGAVTVNNTGNITINGAIDATGAGAGNVTFSAANAFASTVRVGAQIDGVVIRVIDGWGRARGEGFGCD